MCRRVGQFEVEVERVVVVAVVVVAERVIYINSNNNKMSFRRW